MAGDFETRSNENFSTKSLTENNSVDPSKDHPSKLKKLNNECGKYPNSLNSSTDVAPCLLLSFVLSGALIVGKWAKSGISQPKAL